MRAGARAWHGPCLKCTSCSIPLDSCSVVVLASDARARCRACADAEAVRRAVRCAGCGAPIVAGRVAQLGTRQWHCACYCCAQCGRELAQCGAVELLESHAGSLACPACATAARRVAAALCAPRCGGCGLAVLEGGSVAAVGGHFHSACFVCGDCGCALVTGRSARFRASPDGRQAYCDAHYVQRYGVLCALCYAPMLQWVEQLVTGEKICGGCRDRGGSCFSCRRFRTASELVDLPDGRSHCTICNASAVFTDEDASEAMRETCRRRVDTSQRSIHSRMLLLEHVV